MILVNECVIAIKVQVGENYYRPTILTNLDGKGSFDSRYVDLPIIHRRYVGKSMGYFSFKADRSFHGRLLLLIITGLVLRARFPCHI